MADPDELQPESADLNEEDRQAAGDLSQYDEEALKDTMVEEGAGTDAAISAEEAAVSTDTDSAQELNYPSGQSDDDDQDEE